MRQTYKSSAREGPWLGPPPLQSSPVFPSIPKASCFQGPATPHLFPSGCLSSGRADHDQRHGELAECPVPGHGARVLGQQRLLQRLEENRGAQTLGSGGISMGFPGGSVLKNLPANAGDTGLIWVWKILWRRKRQPTPVFPRSRRKEMIPARK